jgi:hypothetical protein
MEKSHCCARSGRSIRNGNRFTVSANEERKSLAGESRERADFRHQGYPRGCAGSSGGCWKGCARNEKKASCSLRSDFPAAYLREGDRPRLADPVAGPRSDSRPAGFQPFGDVDAAGPSACQNRLFRSPGEGGGDGVVAGGGGRHPGHGKVRSQFYIYIVKPHTEEVCVSRPRPRNNLCLFSRKSGI